MGTLSALAKMLEGAPENNLTQLLRAVEHHYPDYTLPRRFYDAMQFPPESAYTQRHAILGAFSRMRQGLEGPDMQAAAGLFKMPPRGRPPSGEGGPSGAIRQPAPREQLLANARRAAQISGRNARDAAMQNYGRLLDFVETRLDPKTGLLPQQLGEEVYEKFRWAPKSFGRIMHNLRNGTHGEDFRRRAQALRVPAGAPSDFRAQVAHWMDAGLDPEQMYLRALAVRPQTSRGSLAVLRSTIRKNRAAGKSYSILAPVGGAGVLGAIGGQYLDQT